MREVAPVTGGRDRPARPCARSVFPIIALSAGAISFVFFAGWAYAHHYFAHFHVGLLALQLPATTFLGFAFWAFQAVWWLVIPYVLGALTLAVYEPRLRLRWQRVRAQRPWTLLQLGVAAALVAFLLAWWIAGLGAERFFQFQRANPFRDLPRVKVWPAAPPEDGALRALYSELPSGVYRVLSDDRERLFLFEPPVAEPSAGVKVIELPWREVRAVQIVP